MNFIDFCRKNMGGNLFPNLGATFLYLLSSEAVYCDDNYLCDLRVQRIISMIKFSSSLFVLCKLIFFPVILAKYSLFCHFIISSPALSMSVFMWCLFPATVLRYPMTWISSRIVE